MPSGSADVPSQWASIQAELRTIPRMALGCRLLHWDPELEKVRSPSKLYPEKEGYAVYWPLDWRSGPSGKPKVFFVKVHKSKYAPVAGADTAERQFGMTYSKLLFSKASIDPFLKSFTACAERAGTLLASAGERLAGVVPPSTFAVKNPLHRWIFAVHDVAWTTAPDTPLRAVRYIPVEGFNNFMGRDESILYDLDHLRSVPWSRVKPRLDPNNWGSADHLEAPYLGWQEKLPEYYASRLDDIAHASELAIGWVMHRLGGPRM